MKLAGRGRRRQELPTTPFPFSLLFLCTLLPSTSSHTDILRHPLPLIPAVGSQRGLEPGLGPAVGCGHRGH